MEILHSPSNLASLELTLMRRIINLFVPYDIDFSHSVKLNFCISSLKLISVPDRAKVIKTWLNGWATTYRIKGDFFHNCLLGCPSEPDSLARYLVCPRIYACMRFVVPGTNPDPLTRCGLCNPSKANLLSTACMFYAYHALKAKMNSEFDACIPDIDKT